MTNNRNQGYLLPAEWYPQSGVQLTWPHKDTDWLYCLDDITETLVQMAKVIAAREPVLIAAREPESVRLLLESRLPADSLSNILTYRSLSNDTWARDHGAITLIKDNGDGTKAARLLDFRFNGWGQKFASNLDNAITKQLYAQGAFNGERQDNDDFVLEGGSIESDGLGTIFTTSCCLLAPNRNQPMLRDQIEEQLRERLGAHSVVWIEHGCLDGDDTDGHIDTLVRTAPNNTLVYCGAGAPGSAQHEGLTMMARQLKELRTTDGKPYLLIELPLPEPIYEDGHKLPATYANFLIINGAVLMPTYNQTENDLVAANQLRLAFPDHEIIGIDSRTVIRQHGSLHCLTMQYPEGIIKT